MVKKSSNLNQLKIGVILSYATTALNMLIGIVYTPVMIRILGQSEYGLYTLVGSVVSYLSLFNLGFSGAYLRFYSRYACKNDEKGVAKLNGMFLTVFLTMGLIALICGMVLSCFTENVFGTKLTVAELEKAKILMRFLVVNIALTFPTSVMSSIINSQEQFLFQRIVTLVGVICNPFICLPLLLRGYGSVAVVAVTTFITFSKLLVDIWYCIKKLNVKFEFGGFEWSLLKEMSTFSFFIFLNMIIDQVNWSIDKFILGRVIGTSAVAVYGVGAQINSLYTGFSTSISSVFAPRINKIVAINDGKTKERLTKLFIKVGRIQALILLLIASGFVYFGKYFITDIYATKEYKNAYIVALLLILPVTIPLIQNLGLEIQRAVNKHRARSIIYFIMAILNALVSIPLAIKFGEVGSAWGTAASLLLANGMIMNVYYHKAIGINIVSFWKNILLLLKGMIIPGVLGCYIMKTIIFKNAFEYLVWIFAYTCVYIISMWKFGMNTYERDLFKKPIQKIVIRKK